MWWLLLPGALGVCAVLAIGAALNSGPKHPRHAAPRHLEAVPDLTLEDIGSMQFDDDPHGPAIVERVRRYGDISGPADGRAWAEVSGEWREQIKAELSPEALSAEECSRESDRPAGLLSAPLKDPGPGGGAVWSSPDSPATPGPDWLEAQLALTFDWVRAMVPQVTGWSVAA